MYSKSGFVQLNPLFYAHIKLNNIQLIKESLLLVNIINLQIKSGLILELTANFHELHSFYESVMSLSQVRGIILISKSDHEIISNNKNIL